MMTLTTRRPFQSGFSLIEIMIVISLIAMIATWAIRNYTGKLEEGRRKGSKIMMQQLRTALDDYMRTCNAYPTSAQGGIDALIHQPSDGSCKDYDPNGYLQTKSIPKDGWGRDFFYSCDDGRKYVLKSFGGDGKEGGQGNDKDLSTEDPDF